MNEAIKIVKAKLNEALDKNDAKAVREACIVLKAMEGYVISNADAETIKNEEAVSYDPKAKVEQDGGNVYLETDDDGIAVALRSKGYEVKNYQPEKHMSGDLWKQLKDVVRTDDSGEKAKELLIGYSDKDINFYIDLAKESNKSL